MPVQHFTHVLKDNPNKPHRHIHHSRLKNIQDIQLVSACIPQSRYILHEHNHFFLNADLIQLPQNNFANTGTRLAETIQSGVRAQTNRPAFTCVLVDNKLEFSDSQAFAIRFGESTLNRNVGLNKIHPNVASRDAGTGLYKLLASNPPSRYTMHMYRVCPSGPGIPSPGQTLAHVITRVDDAITYYSAPRKELTRSTPLFRPPLHSLKTYEIQILDDNNKPVHFNNIHATVVIAITYCLE